VWCRLSRMSSTSSRFLTICSTLTKVALRLKSETRKLVLVVVCLLLANPRTLEEYCLAQAIAPIGGMVEFGSPDLFQSRQEQTSPQPDDSDLYT
jgi:hypothetical protein